MMTGIKSMTAKQMTAMRFLARSFPIPWIPYELDCFSPEHPEMPSLPVRLATMILCGSWGLAGFHTLMCEIAVHLLDMQPFREPTSRKQNSHESQFSARKL